MLATNESFAHNFHKQRVVDANGAGTVLTDVFVLNWPKGSAVRTIGNSVTAALDGKLLGHDPETFPRQVIAWEDGQERYLYSTDSPLHTTTGTLELMPSFAGLGVGLVNDIVPARARIERMVKDAAECLNGAAVLTGPHPDLVTWRNQKRQHLRAARKMLSVDEHVFISGRLADKLDAVLQSRIGGAKGLVLSMYWPIKGEPDLRDLMKRLLQSGVVIALTLVEVKSAPFVFRRWTPQTQMVRGDWNIPVPPADAEIMKPDISLVPLVGWDGSGYRLGCGSGYFDRILASLNPDPFKIGIGYKTSKLATIFPQPHDIPMDLIVTE